MDWHGAYDRQWLSEPDAGFGVGAHRFRGEPQPPAVGERMFTFIAPGSQGKGGAGATIPFEFKSSGRPRAV